MCFTKSDDIITTKSENTSSQTDGSFHKLLYISVLICNLFSILLLNQVLPMIAHIAYDRNTLISLGRGSAGVGLSTVDLETITAHKIFQPPSQTSWTKHHQKQCDCPRKRLKRARIKAELTQFDPKED